MELSKLIVYTSLCSCVKNKEENIAQKRALIIICIASMSKKSKNSKFTFEGSFFNTPHDLLKVYLKDLPYASRYLMVALLSLANHFGSTFYQSDKKLSETFDIPIKTIRQAREKLQERRLIIYKSGHQDDGLNIATTYTILPDQLIRKQLQIRTRGDPKR